MADVNMGYCEEHGYTPFWPDDIRYGGKRHTCKKCDNNRRAEQARSCGQWGSYDKKNAIYQVMYARMSDMGIPKSDYFHDKHSDLRNDLRKEIRTDGSWQKTCNDCGKTKPVTEFNNKSGGGKRYLQSQCRGCDGGTTDLRRRFCTIQMPNGSIEDWIRHANRMTFLNRGGKIIAEWPQDRPGKKWPIRESLLKGVLAKATGDKTPHKYVDADSIPEEEANTRTDLAKGTLWLPEVAAENNLPDLGGTHERRVGAIGLADYGRVVEGLPDDLIDDHPRYLYLLFLDPLYDPHTLKPGGSAVRPDDNLISRYRWRLRPDHPLRYSLDYEYVYYIEKMGAQAEGYLHEVMRAHGQRIRSSEWVRFQNTAAGVTLFTATMKELGATLIYNRKDPTYVPY